ncbi:MAG: hypothetical protein PHY82_07235 [Lentisphaeria bacterium]|nr:hypothetical protein [Lentisphaeria bacterium]
MNIEKFTVSNDPDLYEAWPDVVLTPGGKLICVFNECTHHCDRSYTRIMLTESTDRGRTWSPKHPLTEGSAGLSYYYNCPRIIILHVPSNSAKIWLLTPHHAKVNSCMKVDSNTFAHIFEQQRLHFMTTGSSASEVNLGLIGDIETGYRNFKIEDKILPAFFVKTAKQEISFLLSGGRIINWELSNFGNFVKHENIVNDGFGMDLLWLPVNGRWSGDETAQMSIVSCKNNGIELSLVFAGNMHNALPGIRIEKTYIIRAGSPKVNLEIRLLNENPSPFSTISFWNHNVVNIPSGKTELITLDENQSIVTTNAEIACFSNIQKEHVIHEYLLNKYLKGKASSSFGIYAPAKKFGIKFMVLKDFLMIYRWSDIHRSTLEWMSRPTNVPCGGSLHLDFSIEPIQNISRHDFCEYLKRNE